MADPKEVNAEKPKEAPKPKEVVVMTEPERSPLDTWLDNLPKQLAALVTVDSSNERRRMANALIADLEILHKPAV